MQSYAAFLRPVVKASIGRMRFSPDCLRRFVNLNAKNEHSRFAGRQRLAQRLDRMFFDRWIYFYPTKKNQRASQLHDLGVLYVGDISDLLSDVSYLSRHYFASRPDAIFGAALVSTDLFDDFDDAHGFG